MGKTISFLATSIDENCTERIYRWNVNNKELIVISRQLPGQSESELEIDYSGMSNGTYIIKWGTDTSLKNSYMFEYICGMKIQIQEFEPRGKQYYLSISQIVGDQEIEIIPVVCLRTIIRYPYGRTFMDNFKNLTHRFGQDTVIGYDLKYYSNDDSLDEVKMAIGNTSVSGYLEHIILSVTQPEMTQMQKAIKIGEFLGAAIHHNPIHINLKETVRAIEEFVGKGYEKADIDNEAVWLMELGHTRCGVINGFVSASLLRRINVPNKVYFGCGGHTSGMVFIDGAWRLWDIDAFKGKIPLDNKGNIPKIDWLKQDENIYLLDTVPSWDDSRPDEGWLKTNRGTRMTGYIGGGRYHSETGYGSSFIGGPKRYPPSVPVALPIRKKNGTLVFLEWIGSYCRDNNFRDYLVELTDVEENKLVLQQSTENIFVQIRLPSSEKKYKWSVKARDYHARGTIYEGKIDYTPSTSVEILHEDLNHNRYCWEFLSLDDFSGRVNLISESERHDFIRIEGFDDTLGQTNYCKTELWKLKAGEVGKSIYRLIDESNYWFNGCHIRSLWKKNLQNVKTNKEGWHFTSVLYIDKKGMAGKSKFPVLWIGRDQSYLGFGLIIDPDKGLLFTGSNIFGDWRFGKGFEPCGWFRLDIVNIPGKKTVNYYINGELLYSEDTNIFEEEIFDVDTVYISSNPEAELDYMIGDLLV